MWLIEFTSRGYHNIFRPILTGFLTHLLEFCDGFCGLFCRQWPPHILLFSWRGICCEYLQVWKSFLFFGFTEFGVLDFFEIVWLGHRGDRIEFSMLVEFFFLRGGLAQIFRTCFIFIFFCVDLVPFILLFCFSLSDSLALESFCEGHGVGKF